MIVTTAYLAGPMSGYDLFNWPAFFKAARALREAGWVIENPAETDIIHGINPALGLEEQSVTRDDLLREDFQIITTLCKAIIFLPGWRESVGARAECLVGHLSGLKLYELRWMSDEAFELFEVSPEPEVILQA